MKQSYLLGFLVTVLCCLGCADEVIGVTSVRLNKTQVSLNKGETTLLIATVLPDDATDKTVTWSSSDNSVASVDQDGKLTALKGGIATITAKAGSLTATCQVTVTAEVTSISLNKSSLTLKKGEFETLTATVLPDDAADKTVTWSSSDNSVASVDQDGKVVALKGGNAIITAKAGGMMATCRVTITADVTSIFLSKTSLTLNKGESETISATVLPEDATEKTVSWSSSDNAIASVDQTGKVTALMGGEATITAKAGAFTATCQVTITVDVTSISLSKTSLTLKKGESETLTAVIEPNDATEKTISWSSSDNAIASVDQNGKVTALNGGEATITGKAGHLAATCQVIITVDVTSVQLNKTTLVLKIGESESLIASVEPTDATDRTVSWTSVSPEIASVDQSGLVTAILEGDTYIIAQSGDKSATCIIIVKPNEINSDDPEGFENVEEDW